MGKKKKKKKKQSNSFQYADRCLFVDDNNNYNSSTYNTCYNSIKNRFFLQTKQNRILLKGNIMEHLPSSKQREA